MSWNTYHQRKNAMNEVLSKARRDPSLALDPIPSPFADAGELLAALQHKWMQQLTDRLEVALADTEDSPHGDRVEAVTTAWRRATAANPGLPQLLDAHGGQPTLADGRAREDRMLALAAGLAEEHEPEDEIARVGRAFRTLMSATPTPEERGGFLCKLISTS